MEFQEGKLADILAPGVTVSMPTTYGGSHTGTVLIVNTLGPTAPSTGRMVWLRYWDGTVSAALRTDTRYVGYLHT